MFFLFFSTFFTVFQAGALSPNITTYEQNNVKSEKKGSLEINHQLRKIKKGPFFYILEKNNKTSYALGTQHVGVDLNELQCSDTITNYLMNSEKVFAEHFIPSIYEGLTFLVKFINERNLNYSNQGFKDLDLKDQNFFRKKVYNTDLSKDFVKYIEPLEEQSVVVLNITYQNICFASAPHFFEQIKKIPLMDVSIMSIAQEQNIPYFYLDKKEYIDTLTYNILRSSGYFSLNRLVNLIHLYPYRCNDENLYAKYRSLFSQISKTKEAYIAGNINFPKYSKQEMKELFWKRDKVWVEKIEKAHQEIGNLFIAGGMLHFISDYNLLDRLKEKGFSVHRLNHQCQPEKL